MPNSFLTQRLGLLNLPVTGGGSEKLGDADISQFVGELSAIGTLFGSVLGASEGCVFSGGASSLSDLTDGAHYPAVMGVCVDSSGVVWPFKTSVSAPIVFNATSGSCTLYAVPTLLSGISPNSAAGGIASISFHAVLSNAIPPVASLELGSGTVASSVFTSFTPASLSPSTALLNGGFAYKGAWSNTTTYSTGQVVVYNNLVYMCLVSNVSSEPDSYPTKWLAFWPYSVEQTLTNSATAVPSGAAVESALSMGRSRPKIHTFHQPISGLIWYGISPTGGSYGSPSIQSAYEGSGGRNYVCLLCPDAVAYTASGSFQWTIPPGYTTWLTGDAYNAETAYTAGMICVSSGGIYEAIAETTGNAPPNTSYWKQVDALGITFYTTDAGGSCSLDITIRKNSTAVTSVTSEMSAGAWTTLFFTASELGTWVPGDLMTVEFAMHSTINEYVWLADIEVGIVEV